MVQRISEKLLSWASIIEPDTLDQAARTARLPFVWPHVALMPDAHVGKGATVGSVIPTLGAVIPAAVGVDIGCGMMAVRTGLTVDELRDDLAGLRESIEATVPASLAQYNETITESAGRRIAALRAVAQERRFSPESYDGYWEYQLGSLGSGNHFIEVSRDRAGGVWLFLHSGSRGVGNRIASHHIKVAREVMERFWITLEDPDLAYLVTGTPEFDAYMRELHWAQDFARANREEMMERVIACVADWMGRPPLEIERINCHHNYTAVEMFGDRRVIVSRKGAIDAHQGVAGLIPGSMGSASYVVRGLGNRASIFSAPHGAGRAMSRAKARQRFTQDDLRTAMAGIEYRDAEELVDESPGAYKDVETVMQDSADLVEIVDELHQLVNVKGN
ncbi:MAG: RtcB family protein [Actinomycetia bacterium]|nr:RtcB family protein [Actinomycetes bacterium]